MPNTRPVTVFISYAHEDKEYREQLSTHLATLKNDGLIAEWYDRKIVAGEQWEEKIDKNLESAGLVILLVSSDFINSPYCTGKEMRKAIEMHNARRTYVIPIIIRPCIWKGLLRPFEVLPTDGLPVSKWPDRDDAWVDVVTGIQKALARINPDIEEEFAAEPQKSKVVEPVVREQSVQSYPPRAPTSPFLPSGLWNLRSTNPMGIPSNIMLIQFDANGFTARGQVLVNGIMVEAEATGAWQYSQYQRILTLSGQYVGSFGIIPLYVEIVIIDELNGEYRGRDSQGFTHLFRRS